jgi:hypothetical protein
MRTLPGPLRRPQPKTWAGRFLHLVKVNLPIPKNILNDKISIRCYRIARRNRLYFFYNSKKVCPSIFYTACFTRNTGLSSDRARQWCRVAAALGGCFAITDERRIDSFPCIARDNLAESARPPIPPMGGEACEAGEDVVENVVLELALKSRPHAASRIGIRRPAVQYR